MANGGKSCVSAAEGAEIARLRKAVGDLQAQCNGLQGRLSEAYGRLRAADLTNVIRRLEFLFRVLDHAGHFSPEWVRRTADEIVDLLTVPEDGGEEEGKGDGDGEA